MTNYSTGIPKIKSVEPRHGYKLLISWEVGGQIAVDLTDTINRGGVFGALLDKEKFAAVRVGEGKKIIEWPEPADNLGYPVIEIDSLALSNLSKQQTDANLLSSVKKVLEPIRRRVNFKTSLSRAGS